MIRSQLKRLTKHTLVYGVGQGLNRFITFLLLPVFTRYLSPADYGIMALLGLLTFIATQLFSLGVGPALGVCYFDKDDRRRKDSAIWTASGILCLGIMGLAWVAVACGDAISRALFQTEQHGYLVCLSLLAACLAIAIEPFMLYLRFEEKSKTFVVLTTLSTLITVSFSVTMVVVLERGVQGLVEAGLYSRLITTPLYLAPVMPRIKFRISGSVASEILRLGIPFMPSLAFLFIIRQSNKYILQCFSGLSDVGIYNVGFNFGMFMDLIVSSFTTAWYPMFMSFMDKPDEARELFGRILTYFVFVFGSITLLFFFFAKPVVTLMTQADFHSAYKIVGLSAFAQFLAGTFSVLLPGMYFAKEIKFQSLVQGLAAVGALAMNFVLIRRMGFMGAALGLVAGVFLMVVLQHLWNKKRKYLDVPYEWKRIAVFAGIGGVVGFAFVQDRSFSIVTEFGLAAAASLALPALLYALLNAKERQAVREAISIRHLKALAGGSA